MSFETAAVALAEAMNRHSDVMERHIAALGAAPNAAANAASSVQATGSDKSNKSTSASTADDTAEAVSIYWRNPETGDLGIVDSEAAYKKLKKEQPKVIKVPKSKYDALLAEKEEAEQNNGGDEDGEVSEFVQGILDGLEPSPEESDIVAVFQKYLSPELDKAERTARAGLIKPILEKVKAAKATLVKEGDRYDVMTEVVKAMEAHIEETGQTSPYADDEEGGLV